MSLIKSRGDNPNGLYLRYNVTKVDESDPIDPDATYFVCRLDKGGDDPVWTQACREAMRRLGHIALEHPHLSQVGADLIELCNKLGLADAPTKEPEAV